MNDITRRPGDLWIHKLSRPGKRPIFTAKHLGKALVSGSNESEVLAAGKVELAKLWANRPEGE
jgi:hypothetical protein